MYLEGTVAVNGLVVQIVQLLYRYKNNNLILIQPEMGAPYLTELLTLNAMVY